MEALLFVVFRSRRQKVPIEALIGITCAGAFALSLIVLEKSASGTKEIKEMLTGTWTVKAALPLISERPMGG